MQSPPIAESTLPSPQDINALNAEELKALNARLRWPDGPVCPRCREQSSTPVTPESIGRIGITCPRCNHKYSPTIGAFYAKSLTPRQWLNIIVATAERQSIPAIDEITEVAGIKSQPTAAQAHGTLTVVVQHSGIILESESPERIAFKLLNQPPPGTDLPVSEAPILPQRSEIETGSAGEHQESTRAVPIPADDVVPDAQPENHAGPERETALPQPSVDARESDGQRDHESHSPEEAQVELLREIDRHITEILARRAELQPDPPDETADETADADQPPVHVASVSVSQFDPDQDPEEEPEVAICPDANAPALSALQPVGIRLHRNGPHWA